MSYGVINFSFGKLVDVIDRLHKRKLCEMWNIKIADWLFVAVNIAYIKFLFRMVPCDKVAYWIIHQTLLNEALQIPSLYLSFWFDNIILVYKQLTLLYSFVAASLLF